MGRVMRLLLATVAALLCGAVAAPGAVAGAAGSQAVHVDVQKATLDNGLRVVMNVDRSAPTVAIAVTYNVGARNEAQGRSGFAHLFEHLMFQGSANVRRGQHAQLVSARGGTLNATTSSELTRYYEVLPAGELALGLWLEADRMKSLAISQKSFESQRQVVKEELDKRITGRAYAAGRVRLRELVFQGYWPYGHPVLGYSKDLDGAKLGWVKAFYESYYAPNNAVLSIAGDFDSDQAMRLVREYFGDAKKQPNVPAYRAPPAPRQTTERLAVLQDANVKAPGWYAGWRIAPHRSPEHYALELAAMVLSSGESSRLHRKLVREREIARRVRVWTGNQRGPDLFAVFAELTTRGTVAQVQEAVSQELAALGRTGPKPGELERVKARVRAAFVFGLESNSSRAARLGEFEALWGDARLLSRELDRYDAVTATRIREAVKRYLTEETRTLVEVYPPGAFEEEAPKVGKKGAKKKKKKKKASGKKRRTAKKSQRAPKKRGTSKRRAAKKKPAAPRRSRSQPKKRRAK